MTVMTFLSRTIFQRRLLILASAVFLIFFVVTLSYQGLFHRQSSFTPTQSPVPVSEAAPSETAAPSGHPPWNYKPVPEDFGLPLISDNFPAAMSEPLPPIPVWNALPSPHPVETMPLLIGFTRNWRLLQQAVVSYITAGWPPSEIYVVENTGVMDSNKEGKLSLQNPFFLNYTRLTQLGVNIVRTPTLLNFAQLQNFYISFAVDRKLPAYFWGHMDVIALADETTKSLYLRALDVYREEITKTDWAGIFFAYDRLTLVKTHSYLQLGGWDTFIGYYGTDCDFHERAFMHGFTYPDRFVGHIFDVGRSLDDLSILYRQGHSANDASFHDLFAECDRIQREKNEDKRGRNFWQGRQHGGQDEPFYRYYAGFEQAIGIAIDQGKAMFAEKWGHRDCDLRGSGLKSSDAWKVEKDF